MNNYSSQAQNAALLCLLFFVPICKGQIKSTQPFNSSEKVRIIGTEGTNQYANVHSGLQDKAGNLWFTTTGEGVYRFDAPVNDSIGHGKKFTNFRERDGLSSNEVWCVYEDKDNNIWFGTSYGVCRYDPIDPDDYYDKDALEFSALSMTETAKKYPSSAIVDTNYISTKNAVWSILQDKTGNFWFGTSDGVYRYDGEKCTLFLHNDSVINKSGLHLRHIQSMVEDKQGNIWFASWNQEGACRFDGKTISNFRPNGDGMVHTILEDKLGNIWFGTREHGACRYDGNTFTNFADVEKFRSICIYSMVEDSKGNIWFGTEPGGVWRYDPLDTDTTTKGFTNYTTKDGLCNNAVFSVTLDRSGKFWFGTRETGLCSYDGKKFSKFGE